MDRENWRTRAPSLSSQHTASSLQPPPVSTREPLLLLLKLTPGDWAARDLRFIHGRDCLARRASERRLARPARLIEGSEGQQEGQGRRCQGFRGRRGLVHLRESVHVRRTAHAPRGAHKGTVDGSWPPVLLVEACLAGKRKIPSRPPNDRSRPRAGANTRNVCDSVRHIGCAMLRLRVLRSLA